MSKESRRLKKWVKRTDPELVRQAYEASREVQLELGGTAQVEHEMAILKVKNLIDNSITNPAQKPMYISYAQSIPYILKKYSGTLASKEVASHIQKWSTRGLDTQLLVDIAKSYGVDPTPHLPKPMAISRCIIGFGDAGFIVEAGLSINHQPFSSAVGSSIGMPVPYGGIAKNLKVVVWTNTLNDFCKISVFRNEIETSLIVFIPAGETGTFENNTDTVEFNENDRIFFVIDASSATQGSIDIPGITVAYEG